jgi:hypothetical protein
MQISDNKLSDDCTNCTIHTGSIQESPIKISIMNFDKLHVYCIDNELYDKTIKMYVESPMPEEVSLTYDVFNKKVLDVIGCDHISEKDDVTVMLVIWGKEQGNLRAPYSCHKLFGNQKVTVRAIEEITTNKQIINLIFASDLYVVDTRQYGY